MARGKQTCKILKEIRRQIAEANDIEFVTSECRYKGDCLGTCPKCEAEIRYLEQQLRDRSLAGKAVALSGISAGMILMFGCSGTTSSNQSNETLQGEPATPVEQIETSESIEEEVELPMIEDSVIIKKGEIDDTELLIVGEIDPEQEEDQLKKDIPVVADTISVGGIVLSSDTLPDCTVSKQPLIGAIITNSRTVSKAYTDLEGHFGLPVCVGDTLTVEYLGYDSQTIVVTKDMRDTTITLIPNSDLSDEILIQG